VIVVVLDVAAAPTAPFFQTNNLHLSLRCNSPIVSSVHTNYFFPYESSTMNFKMQHFIQLVAYISLGQVLCNALFNAYWWYFDSEAVAKVTNCMYGDVVIEGNHSECVLLHVYHRNWTKMHLRGNGRSLSQAQRSVSHLWGSSSFFRSKKQGC
jgi:hypothetical protein